MHRSWEERNGVRGGRRKGFLGVSGNPSGHRAVLGCPPAGGRRGGGWD